MTKDGHKKIRCSFCENRTYVAMCATAKCPFVAGSPTECDRCDKFKPVKSCMYCKNKVNTTAVVYDEKREAFKCLLDKDVLYIAPHGGCDRFDVIDEFKVNPETEGTPEREVKWERKES